MFLLVVADVEREGDDLRGDFGREARERLCGEFRGERLPVSSLVRREAAGHGDFAQVSVSSIGRDRGARGDEICKMSLRLSVSRLTRRDVEVEIVRMLPAVDPGELRSPLPKRVGAKKAAKKLT